MKALTTLLMAAGAALLPLLAQAQGIGRISGDDRSDPYFSGVAGLSNYEFQAAVYPSQPVLHGRSASFSSRLAWYSGMDISSLSFLALADFQQPELGYLLRFTVFDPRDEGYRLQVQSQLLGVLSTRIDGSSSAEVALSAFSVAVDDGSHAGSLFVDLPTLATHRHTTSASALAPRAFSLVDERGTAGIGDYVGTRDFLLSVRADPHVLQVIGSLGTAQGHMQFGLAPDLPALSEGQYSGPANLPIGTLGHFLTVSAEFAPLAAVPEPGSWVLLAAGLGVLVLRQRRTRNASACV